MSVGTQMNWPTLFVFILYILHLYKLLANLCNSIQISKQSNPRLKFGFYKQFPMLGPTDYSRIDSLTTVWNYSCDSVYKC